MVITKIVIHNYKLIENAAFDVARDLNIFVGDNDSGKSTLLEAISILTTGKLNGYAFDKQIRANVFNNTVRENYIRNVQEKKEVALPEILLEAYCSSDDAVEFATFKARNNSLHEDCPGTRVLVEFDKQYEQILKDMLDKDEVYDIPVEFYKVSINYFNGSPVAGFRNSPIKAVFIDTTRKDYANMVDRFVSESITTYLTEEERTNLSTAYRKNRHDFHSHEVVKKLNEGMMMQGRVSDRVIRIDLKEESEG